MNTKPGWALAKHQEVKCEGKGQIILDCIRLLLIGILSLIDVFLTFLISAAIFVEFGGIFSIAFFCIVIILLKHIVLVFL